MTGKPPSQKARLFTIWKQKARELKIQTYALYLAYRDPRVSWFAKGFAGLIVAYAFSPIDLIPDFIPVLGYLDDLVIIPLGVFLALKMIPENVMVECRARSVDQIDKGVPEFKRMGIVVVSLWIVSLLLVIFVIFRIVRR